MSAEVSIRTTETITRDHVGVVSINCTEKVYESAYWAKETLDETLYYYLAGLGGQDYKLVATQHGFTLRTIDARDPERTRFVEMKMILDD